MAAFSRALFSVPEVVPLTEKDVVRLNADANPRIREVDIRGIVSRSLGRSFWIPETGEFILVTPWRSRFELPCVHTLWSFQNDMFLIDAASEASEASGAAALLMLESGERRTPSFYASHEFQKIEIIRTYEHPQPAVLARQLDPSSQHFVRVTLDQPALLDAVMTIDHASFSWFWWNSREEFEAYLAFPGIEVWAGIRGDDVVSYLGITAYHQWAHLDRIAVMPGLQRQGLGRSALAFAAQQMEQGGAARIGLSTQNANRVSQHLYESVGFRHTRHSDYDVYGRVFDPERVYRPPTGVLEPR